MVAIILTVSGYPFALATFGIIGVTIPAYDILLEKQGKSFIISRFLRFFKYPSKGKKSNESSDCKNSTTYNDDLCCNTIDGRLPKSHIKTCNYAHNQDDGTNSHHAMSKAHSVPPEDGK